MLVVTRHCFFSFDITNYYVLTQLLCANPSISRSHYFHFTDRGLRRLRETGLLDGVHTNSSQEVRAVRCPQPPLTPRPMVSLHAFLGRDPSQGLGISLGQWLKPEHCFDSCHLLNGSRWWCLGRKDWLSGPTTPPSSSV